MPLLLCGIGINAVDSVDAGRGRIFGHLRHASWHIGAPTVRILRNSDGRSFQMRMIYRNTLKRWFRAELVRYRNLERTTQSEMSERLAMDERSYIDLEHGKTCCSAVTLALYLTLCCDDPARSLEELRRALGRSVDGVA